jgi:type I restriction enzyme S subunit
VKDGWTAKALRDVCQFSIGLWKGAKPPFVNVGVIRNTNFSKDGTLDYSDIAYLDVEASQLEKRRLRPGDIILEKSGGGPNQPVGRVALFDRLEEDFSFSNFTAALRIHDPLALDYRFLHRFLYWTYLSGATEAMQSHSTGIRNLSGDAYKGIKISYPRLSEQRRIVALLEESLSAVAAGRANTERNLANARGVAQGHIDHVFADAWGTCDLVTLADLASDITDGDHQPPPKSRSGVPFITISNIVKETRTIDFSSTFMVPSDYFQRIKPSRKPMKGDVLYTVTGSFGIPVIVEDSREFCFQRHIALIRPRPEISTAWLFYLLSSSQVFRQADSGATGTAQRTVSLRVLRALKVPKVALATQQQVVEKLDAVAAETQRLSVLSRRKLVALDELKMSLLNQAFSGGL